MSILTTWARGSEHSGDVNERQTKWDVRGAGTVGNGLARTSPAAEPQAAGTTPRNQGLPRPGLRHGRPRPEQARSVRAGEGGKRAAAHRLDSRRRLAGSKQGALSGTA